MDWNDENLPERVREELKGMYTPRGSFSAGRDERILRAAMSHIAPALAGIGSQRREWRIRRWGMSGAVAAAVAVVVGGFWYVEWGHEAKGENYVRTGDVRDAFYLARELKAGKAMGAQWDVEGNGVVDERAVKALAMAAVRISDAEGGAR